MKISVAIKKFSDEYGYKPKDVKDAVYYAHSRVVESWNSCNPVSLVYRNILSFRVSHRKIWKKIQVLGETDFLNRFYDNASNQNEWRKDARGRETSIKSRMKKYELNGE
jgi:hypothetical protein